MKDFRGAYYIPTCGSNNADDDDETKQTTVFGFSMAVALCLSIKVCLKFSSHHAEDPRRLIAVLGQSQLSMSIRTYVAFGWNKWTFANKGMPSSQCEELCLGDAYWMH